MRIPSFRSKVIRTERRPTRLVCVALAVASIGYALAGTVTAPVSAMSSTINVFACFHSPDGYRYPHKDVFAVPGWASHRPRAIGHTTTDARGCMEMRIRPTPTMTRWVDTYYDDIANINFWINTSPGRQQGLYALQVGWDRGDHHEGNRIVRANFSDAVHPLSGSARAPAASHDYSVTYARLEQSNDALTTWRYGQDLEQTVDVGFSAGVFNLVFSGSALVNKSDSTMGDGTFGTDAGDRAKRISTTLTASTVHSCPDFPGKQRWEHPCMYVTRVVWHGDGTASPATYHGCAGVPSLYWSWFEKKYWRRTIHRTGRSFGDSFEASLGGLAGRFSVSTKTTNRNRTTYWFQRRPGGFDAYAFCLTGAHTYWPYAAEVYISSVGGRAGGCGEFNDGHPIPVASRPPGC
jgi:hypothetical protein